MKVTTLWALLALLVTAAAHATVPCSQASLNGRYVISARSDVSAPEAMAQVGLVDFDGRGHMHSVATVSVDGVTVADYTLSGVYTVNANCALTQTAKDSTGATVHSAGVITAGGQHILLIGTDPDSFATGDALRLEQTSCRGVPAASYVARGLMLYSPAGPETHVSIVNGDAAGNLLITDSTTKLGSTVSTGGSGTALLTVHPDCTLGMVTAEGGSHYAGVVRVTDQRVDLYLLGTDRGTTVLYTALGTPRGTPN